MLERTIAKRYAIGLIETVRKLNLIKTVEEELIFIAKFYEGNKELQNILNHPRIPYDKKVAFVERLFKGKINNLLISFINYIIKKKRIDKLPLIAEMFDELADMYESVVRVNCETPFPLNDSQKKRLEIILSKMTGGKSIDLMIKENKEIIGGIVLRIGDNLIDCSVAGKLKKMKEHLLQLAKA